MTIRRNLIRSYVRERFRVMRLETNLKRLLKRLTDEELRAAEIEALELHMDWLRHRL